MTTQRLSKLFDLMDQTKLDTVALNPGASLFYLTGLRFHLMERPVVLLLKENHKSVIVLPELEMRKVDQSAIPLEPFPYGDDPSNWQSAFNLACKEMGIRKVGIEPTQFRYLEMGFLQKAVPAMEFQVSSAAFSALRILKDRQEIEKIREAVKVAEIGLEATKPFIKIGRTEREIASELTIQLLKAGSDPTFPFQPIVSSGANSANPHAVPTDKKLAEGDMLVIDWGAAHDGYISDLTRTFAIGTITPKFRKIADTVLSANQAGCAQIAPEEAIGTVDDAAREIITKAGYGDYFTHRTGHGIGLEGHEEPYVFSSNPLPMDEGMCFTVEPGIYLPDVGGVRIEDNVVVTATGHEVLSSLNREVEILK